MNLEDKYQGVVGGLRWQIFLSTHNNQTDAPISKYFSPFYCVLLMFDIVVAFVFVLFGIVLQVYVTRWVMLKLYCKNKLTWIVLRFWFRIVNFEIHQRIIFIIHQCQFVNQILEVFCFFNCKSESKWQIKLKHLVWMSICMRFLIVMMFIWNHALSWRFWDNSWFNFDTKWIIYIWKHCNAEWFGWKSRNCMGGFKSSTRL